MWSREMWSRVKFLAGYELKRVRLSGLLTGLFYGAMGMAIAGIMISMNAQLGNEQISAADSAARIQQIISYVYANGVFLCIVAILGSILNQENLNYMRTDVFSRKMAFYRKLPFTNNEIVGSRYLVLVAILLPMSVFFYVPFYFIIILSVEIQVMEFVAIAVIWMGFSLVCGALYIYCELGYPGKLYFRFNYMLVVLFLLIAIVLGLLDIHLVGGSLQLVRRFGPWPSILAMLAGVVVAWGIARQTVKRLAVRDLL